MDMEMYGLTRTKISQKQQEDLNQQQLVIRSFVPASSSWLNASVQW
jgi:hypothetical protein